MTKRPRLGVLVVIAVMTIIAVTAVAQNTYRDATGGFLKETTLLASAARTTTGASAAVLDVGPYANGNIFIDVTAATANTGSPSMTVAFQSCPDTTVANCFDHTTTSAITTTGHTLIKVNNFGRYMAIKYTISGDTPSLTFSVKGTFKAIGN